MCIYSHAYETGKHIDRQCLVQSRFHIEVEFIIGINFIFVNFIECVFTNAFHSQMELFRYAKFT